MNIYELYHHGILGQKWGVRRFQYKSGRLTPAGKERYMGDVTKKPVATSKRRVRNNIMTSLAGSLNGQDICRIGSAAVSVAILAIGARTVVKNVNVHRLSDGGKKVIESQTQAETSAPKVQLVKKKSTSTYQDDVKVVNPGWKKQDVAHTYNCTHCVVAMELRRRGYDVEAAPIDSARGKKLSEYSKIFDGIDWTKTQSEVKIPKKFMENPAQHKQRTLDTLDRDLTTFGNGARGVLQLQQTGSGVSHVVSWEVKSHKVIYSDSQSGVTDFRPMLERQDVAPIFRYNRLDNLPLKQDGGKYLGEFVRNH